MRGKHAVHKMAPSDHRAALDIARRLPEWFNQQGLREIERDLPLHEGWVAHRAGRVVGWALVAPRGADSADLTWIGVERGSHRTGVGASLLAAAVDDLRARGVRELFVSTVADSVDYEPYEKTRVFYRACGFSDFRVDLGYFKDPRGDYDRLLLRLPL